MRVFAPPTPPVERETMRVVTWRIVPLVLALYIAAFLDRVNVGFAALRMNQDLGLSATAYGLGSGIFFLGYTLFEVPSNLLLVRVGARRWIARIAISWGLIACAMALVHGPTGFILLRLLLGFAEAGFFPGVIYYFTQWFPERRRARATSLMTIGIPIANIFGGPLGGALLGLDGSLGLAGWQWLFLVEGLPAIMLGLAALRWMPDRPADANWLSPTQREWLEREVATTHGSSPPENESVGAAFSNPAVWWLSLPYGLYLLIAYGLTFWLPLVIRGSLAASDLQIGLITGAVGLVGGTAMLLNSAHSDRHDERIAHTALPLLGVSLALGIAALTAHAIVVIVAIALAIASCNAFLPVFWCLPSRFLRGRGAAAGIALVSSVGNIGAFIGPTAVGAVKSMTGGYAGAFATFSGLAFVASLAMLTMRHSDALPTRSRQRRA